MKKLLLSLVATLVILGIFVYQFVLPENLNSDNLFADNFDSYPTTLIQETFEESQEIDKTIFNQAIIDYQQGNFGAAAIGFKKLQEEQSYNYSLFQFYEGVSQLGAHHNGEAIQIFYDLLKDSDHLLMEQSRWYLALTYLQYDNWAKTKEILKEIQADAYKYKEAQRLFRTINAIQKKKYTVE